MGKRKRLTPATALIEPVSASLETHTAPSLPGAQKPLAPIAKVAGDAAAQAALTELADEMNRARQGGRLVQALPLAAIVDDHMVRDRMAQDPVEMQSLKASIAARGQQTPIEVVDLDGGRFGLISGWRRLHGLRALHAETGEARFAKVKALIKPIETVSDGYVAMVEENEIRANLSFYERARLVCEAARLGVYPTPAQAAQLLFANAPAAKRSKILAFVKLHDKLGKSLRFPAAIPEKLGLALVGALEKEPEFGKRVQDALRKTPPADAADERAMLERALRRAIDRAAPAEETVPGVRMDVKKGQVVLSGRGVTSAFRKDLKAWLEQRGPADILAPDAP